MAKYKSVVITSAGLELVAATHSGSSIQFTELRTGSGVYDGTEILENMTDLKEIKQTFGITSVTREAAVVKVRSILSNEGITEGYYMTELGLYALDPNTSTEILYAIIIAENGAVDYFTPYEETPQSITLEVYITATEVEEGVTFTATILDNVYVTAEDLEGIRTEVEALKKSASDGKTLVASAITDKGISTAKDATYQTMATNIRNIQTGIDTSDATVTASQVLSGAVAYGKSGKVVGTMANNGAVNKTIAANGSYTIPAGYHNGSGKVTVDGLTTAKLNVFTQASEPATKDGIWVKTTNPHKKVIIDNRVLNEGGAWASVAQDLPFYLYGGSAVVCGGEIYILGSYISTSGAYFYKWNGSSWVGVGTLPYNFYDGVAVVYNGEIHLIGGKEQGSKHHKWNGSSWVTVSSIPFGVYKSKAVVYNGEIHVMGGEDYSLTHYKWNGSSWVSVSTLPYNFKLGSAVVHNGEIHILGSEVEAHNKKHYKWNGSSWVSVSTLPYGFYQGAAVVYNNEIHMLAGRGGNVSHYKWNGSSWEVVSTLPFAMYWGDAVVLNNNIVMLGSGYDPYYRYWATFTTPPNIYTPYTLIIQRGNTHTGKYLTAIADTSVITGSNNRFLSGFDDVWYFGAAAFEMTDPMYYGNGTSWIKFKN